MLPNKINDCPAEQQKYRPFRPPGFPLKVCQMDYYGLVLVNNEYATITFTTRDEVV